MNEVDLEFLISQYVDGTLDSAGAAALEALLREDEQARAMLADHQRITTLLGANTALPAIKWDLLAETIGQNIDRAEARRIEQRFALPFGRIVAGAAAVAACLLVGLLVFRGSKSVAPNNGQIVSVPAARAKVIEISLPSGPVAAAPRVAEVSIDSVPGQSPMASLVWEDLQPRSMRIVIAAGEPPNSPGAFYGY